MGVLLLAGAAAAAAPCAGASPKPNILHVLLDDFGWADAGWHRPPGYTDLQSESLPDPPHLPLSARMEALEAPRHARIRLFPPICKNHSPRRFVHHRSR